MSEASSFCADHVDAIDELCMAFAMTGADTYHTIRTSWTIDDFVKGWIFLQRKSWMEEAHTMLVQEQREET